MKVLNLVFILAAALAVPAFGAEQALDKKTTKISWHGSKVVGGSHNGTIDLKAGSVNFKKGEPAAAEIVIDMTSIKNEDLTDKKWNKKLVDHLNSDDFFSTTKHETATLKADRFVKVTDDTYKVYGKLTVKGKTKEIDFTAKVKRKDKTINTVDAEIVFDRTEFDVRYGSGKFFENLGDKMIADEVKISTTLNFAKPTKLGKN